MQIFKIRKYSVTLAGFLALILLADTAQAELRIDITQGTVQPMPIAVVDFFGQRAETEAVLLVNSCARGKATPDSCLDIAVLVRPEVLMPPPA